MTSNLKISVIMSVYNGDKYINESVSSILNQSYSDFEFIIIDDGSTDNTNTILESIIDSRLNIIHQSNKGVSASLNKAISLSKGEYIVRHDADDISLPDRFEKQLEFLENMKDYVLVGSNSYLINEKNEHIGMYKLPQTDTEIRWTILFRNPFCHSTVMIRGDILRDKGVKYNEYLKSAQDFELWSKLIKFGKISNIENALVKYRIHPGQICQLHNAEQQENALLISKSNLEDIGFQMSKEEALILRQWAFNFPSTIRKKDLYLYDTLFRILNKFKYLPYIDRNNFDIIKNNYVRKYCNAINTGNILSIMFSPMFIAIFYGNLIFCLKNVCSRIANKAIH